MKEVATTPVVGVIVLNQDAAVGSLSMHGHDLLDIGLLYIVTNGDPRNVIEVTPEFTEASISNQRYDRIDALVVIGELDPPEKMPLNPRLVDLLQRFDVSRKPVGGLMAGVVALGEAGLVVGKFVSVADESMANNMRNYGALPLMKPVVSAGWIVTSASRDSKTQFWNVLLNRISDVET